MFGPVGFAEGPGRARARGRAGGWAPHAPRGVRARTMNLQASPQRNVRRVRLRNSTPLKSWEVTREAYGNRLKRCCDQINKELKVEELCKAFPKRIRTLEDKKGGRLRW